MERGGKERKCGGNITVRQEYEKAVIGQRFID